ncbi:hypothetical protein DXG01_009331 [Tephrocybe rancida]|nr:hypothetical protein DXG01_009331 [Tephrocybe rancida]
MLSRIPAVLLAQVYLVAAWSTFVVPHADGQDDMPGLVAAIGNYSTNSTVLFQQGVNYNIFSPIKFPALNNVEIRIEGNLSYPTDIPAIQAIVGSSVSFEIVPLITVFEEAASQSFPGAWFTFSGGNNVTLRGSTDPKWGWVDGHGQAWWDTQNQVNRPHGWQFNKINNGVIRDMKLWMPIAWNFATSGSTNLHAYNNKIVAVSNSKNASHFPFNTDGFSAGGTNMLFENNHIQNGDDCLTVGSGAKNIHFRNTYCEGGHGLSIGSLGKGGAVAAVQDVVIENIVMNKTLYGARFKSWTGGNGLARNITWKDIYLSDVRFPVGPAPNATTTNNTHIQDFTFQNFAGTLDEYFVQNATGRDSIIFDLYPDTATNILAKDIFVVTKSLHSVNVLCDPVTVTNDVGFKCRDGSYVPTRAGLFK